MNFQQVKQANGNNVTMFGTFDEIGGVSLTQNQKQVCKCQIVDDNGEKHLVRLYGTMPHVNLLRMRQEFSLSSYQGTSQRGQPYTGFSGFWEDRAQVNQVPANAPRVPQNIPQAPQVAPQPTIPPYNALHSNEPYTQSNKQDMKMPDTYAYPVTPETADRMARAVCVEAMLRNGQKPLYSYVTELVDFIRTGIDPEPQNRANPNYVGDGQEGICPHCQKPLEDCTCDIKF